MYRRGRRSRSALRVDRRRQRIPRTGLCRAHPQGLAGLEVVGRDDFVFAALLLSEEAIAVDREG